MAKRKKWKELIPDFFGKHIGGACRETWKAAGLDVDNLNTMNSAEVKKYVTKDYVWPRLARVKAVEAVNAGEDPFILYWRNYIRRRTYSVPTIRVSEDFISAAKQYIIQLRMLKDAVENVETNNDISTFYNWLNSLDYSELARCANVSDLRRTRFDIGYIRNRCTEQNYPFNERKGGKRKKSFIPPQLTNIEREGPNYRFDLDVTPEFWQQVFNFRGVEFGNWTSQKDRQFSMNYAFDALIDMAHALEIENKDVAFNGQLALAFGSRGRTHTSAHYEPEYEVINLTKMHGAGCTAHEWFHALDNKLAKHFGITDSDFASETKETDKLPEVFNRLVKALKYDDNGKETDFYMGSKSFDKHFRKNGFGYWASNCEMAARAFACYVSDMLNNAKSDYLIAYAKVYKFEFDNQEISAIPQDEYREDVLDELFEQLFYELKEIGFFHERSDEDDNPSMISFPAITVEKTFIGHSPSSLDAIYIGDNEELGSVLAVAHDVETAPVMIETNVKSDGAETEVTFKANSDGQLEFYFVPLVKAKDDDPETEIEVRPNKKALA